MLGCDLLGERAETDHRRVARAFALAEQGERLEPAAVLLDRECSKRRDHFADDRGFFLDLAQRGFFRCLSGIDHSAARKFSNKEAQALRLTSSRSGVHNELVDRAQFWSLMKRVDRGALDDGDEAAAVEPLTDALAKLSEPEIAGFAEQLAQALYDLDGEVFADHAGESGGSCDGFLYTRCFVVARGEQHYQRVLAEPAAMPTSLDDWCESLLYVAARAWARATGSAEEDWDHPTSVSYETGSNTAKWR